MATLTKIDSNVTELRYAEEDSYGVLPVTPDWVPLEPNSYTDFGGSIVTVARNPINASRQRKKGVTTDLEATGGFDTDITQTNLQDILQGFFFADLIPKVELGGASEITGVATATDRYSMAADGDDFAVNSLVYASGFTNAGNNGLHLVDESAATYVGVAENLVDEVSPPAVAKLVTVGVQGTAGDIDVSVAGTLPALTSTSLDFTTLGLSPGEWIFIGGDATGKKFVNAANNGFARVRSVAANTLTLDKTQATMVTEASTTETIQIFFGRVLKNQTGSSIVRRTYQLERALGAPDDAAPAEIQGEYLVGAVPNEFALKIPAADKVTATLSFVPKTNEVVTGSTGLKTGNRPSLVEADAFNTSSDFSRIKLALVSSTDAAPDPLFAFVQEINLSINNNVTVDKAVGVLGGFEATAGSFIVSGDMQAYFADVTAVSAVRNNEDITLDIHMVKANAGISIDVPLIALGDAKANVEQDKPIMLPLKTEAATGAKIASTLDHTLLMVFWDYLPDAAE